MIRDLVGQQAVDMHEAVLGTITEQYVENGTTWVLTSSPHLLQVHSLIRKPALPFGLLAGMFPQHEQVWVV